MYQKNGENERDFVGFHTNPTAYRPSFNRVTFLPKRIVILVKKSNCLDIGTVIWKSFQD